MLAVLTTEPIIWTPVWPDPQWQAPAPAVHWKGGPPRVNPSAIELAKVILELRPPFRETTKDAEVRTPLEGPHVQENIASFDIFRTPGLVEVEFLPLVGGGQDARREVIALWIEVVRCGKTSGLNGQGIIGGQPGQRFGR